jgi:hypothetical protein
MNNRRLPSCRCHSGKHAAVRLRAARPGLRLRQLLLSRGRKLALETKTFGVARMNAPPVEVPKNAQILI